VRPFAPHPLETLSVRAFSITANWEAGSAETISGPVMIARVSRLAPPVPRVNWLLYSFGREEDVSIL
jgi:hypothetical protein